MIIMTVTAFIAIIALATAIALADSWIRGREVYDQLVHERALARRGFVPVIEATELRQRTLQRSRQNRSRAGASPAFTKRASARAPRPAIAPLGEALGAA